MSAVRFYPLADFPATGILVAADGTVAVADFLTPAKAKEIRRQPYQRKVAA